MMMKQADETILVEQNITEPKTKTLPVNSSDAAEIEEVAETTPPVSESPSPNDKVVFISSGGHLVDLPGIRTSTVLEIQKRDPRIFSIRPVGKEEAHNLGLDERCWLISSQWFDLEEELHVEISRYERIDENGDGKISPAELGQCMEAIGEKSSAKETELVVEELMNQEVVDKDGDGPLGFEIFVNFVEELMKQEEFFERNMNQEDKMNDYFKDVFKMYEMDQVADRELMEKNHRMDMANRRTNRLPTISRKNLKKEQKALKRILHESVLDIQDTDGDGQLGSSSHGRNEENRENNELRKVCIIGGTDCITRIRGKDHFVDPKVFDPLISDGKLETLYKKLHAIWSNIHAVKFPLLWGNRKPTNNLLPVSRNDSANSQFGEEALSFKDFLMSVLNMPGEQRAIMLMVFFGILKTLAESSASTPRFEFQDGIATNILSLREGLLIFSPEIANTCLFIIVYIITWPLILKLQRGQQICLAVLMTFAPFWLLSHLVRNASATGVHVRFCGFNLPVIAFTAVYTFVFCLFFFFAVYLVLSIIWKFFHQRTPARYQEPEGTNALLAGIDLE